MNAFPIGNNQFVDDGRLNVLSALFAKFCSSSWRRL